VAARHTAKRSMRRMTRIDAFARFLKLFVGAMLGCGERANINACGIAIPDEFMEFAENRPIARSTRTTPIVTFADQARVFFFRQTPSGIL